MGFIWGILILAVFIRIHLFLKELKRRQLKDKLLEDQQALAEYARWKMEQEIKDNEK